MERHDEYFTSFREIERELRLYKGHFHEKIVFCNANDSCESAFFKFFIKYFKAWNLKLLYCLSLEGELYIYNGERLCTERLSSGDFRSQESVELLKVSDIVVSNPPFSLFREYFDLLMRYEKKFIIIGNHTAVSYKGIFPYIRDGKVWQGVSRPRVFYDSMGVKQTHVAGLCRWFTNLEHKRWVRELSLSESYREEDYPIYDNLEAIDCKEVKNIPKDYFSFIGVPVSFIDRWNVYQFSIVGVGRNLKIKGERQPVRLLIRRKTKYSPSLSIKELADRNNLSEAAIRKYIRVNKIPRRKDRKEWIFNLIMSLLEENPGLSRREIARKLNLSPTTVSKYLSAHNNLLILTEKKFTII